MTDLTDEMKDARFVLEASPSHLLHRAQQMAATQSAIALKEAGITLRQFSVLAAVAEEEGTSQSRLVEMTGIDRSTLADMVGRMDSSGLLKRVRSESDARAKSVTLTAAGRTALEKAAPSVHEADTLLLGRLPKNRRGSFLDILTSLVEPAPTTAKADSKSDAQSSKSKKKSKKKDEPKAKEKSRDKPKAKAKPKKKAKKKVKA